MSAPHQLGETTWDIQQLAQLHLGFAPSRIISSAIELGVFSQLAHGGMTVTETARACRATERGMRMLLDALVGLQLLAKSDGNYILTPPAAQYLNPDSPDYVGELLALDRLWQSWSGLTEVVRTGKVQRPVEHQREAEAFFPHLIRGLHIVNREPARRTAEALGAGLMRRGLEILDVACGSGVWGIAIAEADPQARITAQDFPGVLAETKKYVKQHGLEARFDYLPGDLKQAPFGQERFDIALLGNIVHSEGEQSSRKLFHKLHRALRSGGRIAIIDMVPNDKRSGPPFPLLFALNMLVNTESGDTFTLEQYREWLEEAGFGHMETTDIGSHSPLIVAQKL